MHEQTGQIGPIDGFPDEEKKHAVPLTGEEYRAAGGMNRKDRRALAKGIRRRVGTKKRTRGKQRGGQ